MHEDAVAAFVAGVDRGRYRCWVAERAVTAMKARELGRRGVVVGDWVRLAGDVSGEPGTLARIVRVEPRTSVTRSPRRIDSYASAAPSGSAAKTGKPGRSACAAIALPPIRPPPLTGAISASSGPPCANSSSATVPCPAITAGSS